MRARRRVAAFAVGLGAMARARGPTLPAMADGDTSRHYGCAAHWRATATWNECHNSSGVQIRLRSDCDWQVDHDGAWKTIKGTVNPVDTYECRIKALGASNGFR